MQNAESARSGHSHVTSQTVFFPPYPIPEGMLRPTFVSPRRNDGSQAFGTRIVYRETFLQIQLRPPQHLIRRNSIHGVRIYQNTHITTCEE